MSGPSQVKRSTRADYPLWRCPACGYHGIQNVTGGVGLWPGDGKVRCPSRTCEYATVMEQVGVLVERDPVNAEWSDVEYGVRDDDNGRISCIAFRLSDAEAIAADDETIYMRRCGDWEAT